MTWWLTQLRPWFCMERSLHGSGCWGRSSADFLHERWFCMWRLMGRLCCCRYCRCSSPSFSFLPCCSSPCCRCSSHIGNIQQKHGTNGQRTKHTRNLLKVRSHSETHRPIERQAFSAREGCFRQCALYGMAVFHTGGLFSGPFSAVFRKGVLFSAPFPAAGH